LIIHSYASVYFLFIAVAIAILLSWFCILQLGFAVLATVYYGQAAAPKNISYEKQRGQPMKKMLAQGGIFLYHPDR
jgi:hypothetical protein